MSTKTFYCVKCGKGHTVPLGIGPITITCTSCGKDYSVDTGVSEEPVPTCTCAKCRSKLYMPANIGKVRVTCPVCLETQVCDTDHLEEPAPEHAKAKRFCQYCGKQMYVPLGVGRVRITCPNEACGKVFELDTDVLGESVKTSVQTPPVETARPVEPPRPVDPPKPVEQKRPVAVPIEEPKPVFVPEPVTPPAPPPDPYHGRTRRLRFLYWSERIGHTFDPLANFLSKGSQLNIFDNGEQIGSMPSGGETTIDVNPGEHHLSIGMTFTSGLFIPADDKDYLLLVNKEGISYSLAAMPEYDPFYEGLEKFFLGMCEKQGLADRILMNNNRNKKIHMDLHKDHISLEWDLDQTHGLKQWATGRDGEKIYYANIGLNPPPFESQPGNYWTAVRMVLASAINRSGSMYHCSVNGIITMKTINDLY